MIPHGSVIYLDPPYANVKKYANASCFDYNTFWDYCREISKDNIVLISELDAPDDFECIWSQQTKRSINSNNIKTVTEKLYIHKE